MEEPKMDNLNHVLNSQIANMMGGNFSKNSRINIIIYPFEEEANIASMECFGANNQEMEEYKKIAFAIETVIQTIIGIAGLVTNLIALPILCK